MQTHFIQLADFSRWANARVLDCMLALPEVPARMAGIFAHVLAAEKVWLWRLTGRDSSLLSIWPDTDLDTCRAQIDENHAGYVEFLNSAAATDLSRTIDYRTSKGDPFSTPITGILTQVYMHGNYHRGQIVADVKAAGGTPVGTDFILYLRERG